MNRPWASSSSPRVRLSAIGYEPSAIDYQSILARLTLAGSAPGMPEPGHEGKGEETARRQVEKNPLPPGAQRPLCRVTRCYPSCRDIPIMTGDDAVNGSEGNRIAAARETLGL